MNVMISSTTFWLVTTAIIILIACYIIFLVKFKSAEESSDFSGLPELLLETSENLPAKRRRELLEKIKEERIKEYLDHKKRKTT